MANIREYNPAKYNSALALALKEFDEFSQPAWAQFVKSSPNKQRPIAEIDFWYKRAASILRQVYLKGSVGVQRLRSRYGGNKNRGNQPSQFRRASGKMIRTILQQAESAGLLEKSTDKKAGRKLTEKGIKFLESISISNGEQ